jgi:hypothetical protein
VRNSQPLPTDEHLANLSHGMESMSSIPGRRLSALQCQR